MLDSESNSEPEIDETKVEKQLQKDVKKKLVKNVQKSQLALDLAEMLGCQFLDLVERLNHHVLILVEVLGYHVLDLEEEQQVSNPNHLAIMRTGINKKKRGRYSRPTLQNIQVSTPI